MQKAYERLVRDNRRRFVVVDAARGVDEVARDALDAVLERLLPDRRAWKREETGMERIGGGHVRRGGQPRRRCCSSGRATTWWACS